MNTNIFIPLAAALSMLGSAGALAQTPAHPRYNPSDIVAMKPGQTIYTVTEAQLGNASGWRAPAASAAQVTLKPGQQS